MDVPRSMTNKVEPRNYCNTGHGLDEGSTEHWYGSYRVRCGGEGYKCLGFYSQITPFLNCMYHDEVKWTLNLADATENEDLWGLPFSRTYFIKFVELA